MSWLLAQILRALVRQEKKIDALIEAVKSLQVKSQVPVFTPKLDQLNQVCPLCQQRVEYQPVMVPVPGSGDTMEVMVRTCMCEPRATKQPITGDIL
jgi:hypothetical protein